MKTFDERKEEVLSDLETRSKNDYQKDYDYLLTEYREYTEKVDEYTTSLNETIAFYTQLIEKYKSKRDYIVDETEDLIKKAESENIKLKTKKLKYY